MKFVAVVMLVLSYLSSAKAIDPDASVCFANQELSFFCDAKVYPGAKKSCKNRDSYLVKVDSADMTEVVNSLMDKTKCPYINGIFIGGITTSHPDFPSDRSKRIWTWLDGSKVFLPTESGYQNWQSGQPNDAGRYEDCLMVDINTKQWKDTICSGYPPDPKYYICQKNATVNHKVSQTLNEVRCEAAIDSCRTHIEWRRGSSIVPYNSSEAVYQISNLTSSILYHKYATIGDAGKYECVGWIIGDKANSGSISVDISVNGTPEVIDIRSFTCNTSLQIAWKPQFQSLGYLHRIVATARLSGKLKRVVEVTPTNAVVHLTEVTKLEPSTDYEIKIAACKDVNNCSDEYAAMKTATTSSGIIYTVTNATIQQSTHASDLPICVVTWQWTHNMTDTFQITSYYNSSETQNFSIIEQTIFTKTNLYFFIPFPGRKYDVEIQPVTNKNYCSKPVKAVESCIGKSEEIPATMNECTTSTVVAMSVVISILLVVIFSMAIYIYKRLLHESPQTPVTEPSNVHDYATVRNPEINEAAYLDLTDNTPVRTFNAASAGNLSYENIVQNSPTTYETIKNITTSEYEM